MRPRYRAEGALPLLQPALADLLEERLVADIEQAGGALAVPLGAVQRAVDRLALRLLRRAAADLLERQLARARRQLVDHAGEPVRTAPHAVAGQQLLEDRLLALQHHDALDQVLELTDVAREGIAVERARQRAARLAQRLGVAHREAPQEGVDEQRNVLAPLAQRRDVDV